MSFAFSKILPNRCLGFRGRKSYDADEIWLAIIHYRTHIGVTPDLTEVQSSPPSTAIAGWQKEAVLRGEPCTSSNEENFSMERRAREGNIMKWLWAAFLTSLGVMSAEAYTCADVRSLSLEQQAYYIRALDITPAADGGNVHDRLGAVLRAISAALTVVSDSDRAKLPT
jgi:hypothetical protein